MMQFLENLPPYIFFTGKGGVGKTSLSCATAIFLAQEGKSVLLVSTDPASNVGQVFSQSIGNTITAIHSIQGLSAIEINPQEVAESYRSRILDPVRNLLPPETLKSMEEQLSGACTIEIAAFDEFTSLLTDKSLLTKFDHIVFDTAPTGHTIRLLQLPRAWNNFIEENPDGSSCLGPMSGLQKQKDQYSQAVEALSQKDLTRLILVARLQKSTLEEASRTYEELKEIGLKNQYLVLNGILRKEVVQEDALALSIYEREQEVLKNIPFNLKELPQDRIYLKPWNMVGFEALESLFKEDREDVSFSLEKDLKEEALSLPSLSSLVDELAQKDQGLIMLMGKGGVGKTTMASAIAVELVKRGKKVHLTTSDPAAHLSESLANELENLQVSRINPEEETECYRREVLEKKGKSLDEEGRRLLEEDLRSPCTEEIAVFQAFSRIIRESSDHFVVMDTAPTGHTLLLLDATGAYHREISKQMEGKGHFTTPMMNLQNADKTKVIITTLAETTPVLEAIHLQEDLMRANIHPWAWIINNSLLASQTKSPLLYQRALREKEQIPLILKQSERVVFVPLVSFEPVGVEALEKLL